MQKLQRKEKRQKKIGWSLLRGFLFVFQVEASAGPVMEGPEDAEEEEVEEEELVEGGASNSSSSIFQEVSTTSITFRSYSLKGKTSSTKGKEEE